MKHELSTLLASLLAGILPADTPQEESARLQDLLNSPAWKQIESTWAEAREVALGRRGAYPYSESERKALATKLDEAAAALGPLQQKRLLREAEAALLADALEDLRERAMGFLATEWASTCYIGMGGASMRPSVERLERRIPLLESLAKEKRVNKQVLSRVLGNITRDMNALDQGWGPKRMTRLNPKEGREWARKAHEALKELLPPPAESPIPLVEDSRWKAILEACKAAHPYQTRIKGKKYEAKDLNRVDRSLGSAREAASLLALEGRIDLVELRLLHAELERLRLAVDGHRFRDGKFHLFSTDTMFEAERATKYLSWAVPIVLERARSKKLRPEFLPLFKEALSSSLKDLLDTSQVAYDHARAHPGFPGLAEKTRAALHELFE